MTEPKALVLAGDGINCEVETAFALAQAGFSFNTVHVSDLLNSPESVKQFQLVVLPGGFSFGDEIASGKVLALKMQEKLGDVLKDYVERGSLLFGVCNGFQVLVQLGILPPPKANGKRLASLVHNSGGRFINRWVPLIISKGTKCAFLQDINYIELPIRHGEGQLKVEPTAEDYVGGFGCLKYGEDVNGSFAQIAGLTNAAGNVFGLMPHPEAFIRWTQHPAWTARRGQATLLKNVDGGLRAAATLAPPAIPHGKAIFESARKAIS